MESKVKNFTEHIYGRFTLEKFKTFVSNLEEPNVKIKYILLKENEFLNIIDWTLYGCTKEWAEIERERYLEEFKNGREYTMLGFKLKYGGNNEGKEL